MLGTPDGMRLAVSEGSEHVRGARYALSNVEINGFAEMPERRVR